MAIPIPLTHSTLITRLPMLKNDTRYAGLPKRFELTNTVAVQNFTHRYIVDLGKRFQKTAQDTYEAEKDGAVKEAEEVLWEKAEELRRDTVSKALVKARTQHDKELRKNERAHARKLKDELTRLEEELLLKAEADVKEARADADAREEEAVTETKKRCEAQLLIEVEQARVDEREKSIQEIEDLKTGFRKKLAAVEKSLLDEKSKALADLSDRLDCDREHAVHCAQHVERVIMQELLAKQKQLHDQATRVIDTRLTELNEQIEQMEQSRETILNDKRKVEKEVILTRKCFQHFIDHVTPFEPDKSEFVIPPMIMERTPSLLDFERLKNWRFTLSDWSMGTSGLSLGSFQYASEVSAAIASGQSVDASDQSVHDIRWLQSAFYAKEQESCTNNSVQPSLVDASGKPRRQESGTNNSVQPSLVDVSGRPRRQESGTNNSVQPSLEDVSGKSRRQESGLNNSVQPSVADASGKSKGQESSTNNSVQPSVANK